MAVQIRYNQVVISNYSVIPPTLTMSIGRIHLLRVLMGIGESIGLDKVQLLIRFEPITHVTIFTVQRLEAVKLLILLSTDCWTYILV